MNIELLGSRDYGFYSLVAFLLAIIYAMKRPIVIITRVTSTIPAPKIQAIYLDVIIGNIASLTVDLYDFLFYVTFFCIIVALLLEIRAKPGSSWQGYDIIATSSGILQLGIVFGLTLDYFKNYEVDVNLPVFVLVAVLVNNLIRYLYQVRNWMQN